MSNLSELYTYSKNKRKVPLDLSHYAKQSDLKSAASANTSNFAKKIDLASLKSDVGKLDINIFETTTTDLCKLSNVKKFMLLNMLQTTN